MAYIFISYARQDGRELALRLQDDLRRDGHHVWLDTSDISGGASWSREIEEAIERCDIELALLSAGSFRSEICRAEHLRALRKGKRVVPLLGECNPERRQIRRSFLSLCRRAYQEYPGILLRLVCRSGWLRRVRFKVRFLSSVALGYARNR